MGGDIGYILGPQDDYSELRYSLRSLRFLPHRNVYIAGSEPPEWVQNVTHIPTDQRPIEGSGTQKYVNIKHNQRLNLLALCDELDDFVLMDDDFMFVKPLETLPPCPIAGTIEETHGVMDPQAGPYQALHFWLKNRGIPQPRHFAEHVPMLMNGPLMGLWMRDAWHIAGFPIPTLYGNMAKLPGAFGDDFVLKKMRHYDGWPESYWAVSTVEWAFYDWPVGERIRKLHFEPGPYEKEGM